MSNKYFELLSAFHVTGNGKLLDDGTLSIDLADNYPRVLQVVEECYDIKMSGYFEKISKVKYKGIVYSVVDENTISIDGEDPKCSEYVSQLAPFLLYPFPSKETKSQTDPDSQETFEVSQPVPYEDEIHTIIFKGNLKRIATEQPKESSSIVRESPFRAQSFTHPKTQESIPFQLNYLKTIDLSGCTNPNLIISWAFLENSNVEKIILPKGIQIHALRDEDPALDGNTKPYQSFDHPVEIENLENVVYDADPTPPKSSECCLLL